MPWSRFTRSNSVGAAEITDGSITTADIAAAAVTAPKLAAGSIVQVVEGSTTTQTQVAATTYADTTLSASITPNSSSNKILVIIEQSVFVERSIREFITCHLRLLRGSTTAVDFANALQACVGVGTVGSDVAFISVPGGYAYLDSPATTSSVTYKTQIKASTTSFGGQVGCQYTGSRSTMLLMEVRA